MEKHVYPVVKKEDIYQVIKAIRRIKSETDVVTNNFLLNEMFTDFKYGYCVINLLPLLKLPKVFNFLFLFNFIFF